MMRTTVKEFAYISIVAAGIFGCNTGEIVPAKMDSTSVTKHVTSYATHTAFGHVDPDTTDSVAAGNYLPNACNEETVVKIRAALRDSLLNDDLVLLEPNQRKFMVFDVDLNNDGIPETFVGFDNAYFCGKEGCTFYLFNDDATVNTKFSNSSFPVIVLNSETRGWKDIVVNSGGQQYFLKSNGKQYPNKLSDAPAFVNALPSDFVTVLDYTNTPFPRYKF